MRTTVDLPDDLFRRAKAVAALQGLSMKDLITSYIETGLGLGSRNSSSGRSTPLPELIRRTGTPIPSLTNAEIDELLLKGDLAHDGDCRLT